MDTWRYILYSKHSGGNNMRKDYTKGSASLSYDSPVYIWSSASIVGKKEGEGPLKNYFDMICEDPMFGEKTWEAAESTMQKDTAVLAIGKAGLRPENIRMAFAGDLLAQTTATSFGTAEMGIPFYGLYGACSTMGESLSLGSMAIAAGYGTYVLCATSSHFASAEKEFRFPLGYGNQRPLSATWTVSGSGACVLSCFPPPDESSDKCTPLRKKNGCAVITGITTGKIVDYGFRDSMNMGGCMAPAAYDTISRHFLDFERKPSDYDAVITGDLGSIGQKILLDLLSQKKYDISSRHFDCGLLIFDCQTQDTHSGGSGCGCAAVVFASYILPKVVSGEWQRILFVPTGALLSKTSYNEGASVPGIAHAIVIEHYHIT